MNIFVWCLTFLQLKCVGSRDLCSERYKPTTVQCHNTGSDGVDVQWRCEAELDSDVAFDNVQVSCEGYYAPEDEYILKGSCGLEYSLKYTNAYKDKQRSANTSPNPYVRPTTTVPVDDDSDGSAAFKFFLLCCAAILFFAWLCKGDRQNRVHPTAPPMNDFVPPRAYTATESTQGPGFGAGVAVGAIGGAAAAHLLHRNTRPEPTYQPPVQESRFRSPSPPPSPPSTHISKGYGGTNKR